MRESKTKKIGTNEYIVLQWGARKAALTKIHILNLVAKNLKDLNLKGATNEEAGVQVIAGILAALDEKTADNLIDRLISDVSVNTGSQHAMFSAIMDDLLAGKTSQLYEVLLFVLEVNYPDFLGENGLAGSFITKLKGRPEKTSA